MTALSIVVPCFDEEACLPKLHERLTAVARATPRARTMRSCSSTTGRATAAGRSCSDLASSDPRLVAINLSRNHGHQLALTAGLDLCRGDVVLVIDADLQDPPELLPAMLATMRREGADVVYGVRQSRAGETAFKRATAHGFYRLLSRATEVDIPLDAGDFRLISRRALDALLAMPEQARFIRGMVAWIGFKQVPLPYDARGALRRRDEISIAQDDPLRVRRADRLLVGTAQACQPRRPLAVARLGADRRLHPRRLAVGPRRCRAGPR